MEVDLSKVVPRSLSLVVNTKLAGGVEIIPLDYELMAEMGAESVDDIKMFLGGAELLEVPGFNPKTGILQIFLVYHTDELSNATMEVLKNIMIGFFTGNGGALSCLN